MMNRAKEDQEKEGLREIEFLLLERGEEDQSKEGFREMEFLLFEREERDPRRRNKDHTPKTKVKLNIHQSTKLGYQQAIIIDLTNP